MKHIPYGRQDIEQKDIDAVVEVLKSNLITQGPKIQEFEDIISKTTNSKYSVVFSSGTAALHAAYYTFGLNKNDHFITSPMTFAATANAGVYLGAKPIFCDINSNTGNIDIDQIEKNITKSTKLIVPIHYGGNPCELDKIARIAKKYKLGVIEDSCHALGGQYKKSLIGDCKFSDMCVFSFHPVKHITTAEGGAVTTNEKSYYEKLLQFRTHGITKTNLNHPSPGDWYYEMQFLGYNYRLNDIQAALGISQIKRLNQFIKKRREIALYYNIRFNNNTLFNIQDQTKDAVAAYHLYPILLNDRAKKYKKDIFSDLRKAGIGVQTHYIPVYFHPFYERMGYKKGICPIAEDFYNREISIPIFPTLNKTDQETVINKINSVIKFNINNHLIKEYKTAIHILKKSKLQHSKNLIESELSKIQTNTD